MHESGALYFGQGFYLAQIALKAECIAIRTLCFGTKNDLVLPAAPKELGVAVCHSSENDCL